MEQDRRLLFPCNTTKLAAMYETEEFYIITGEDECEMHIDKSSPTAELEAWIAYSGALDTAVHRRLRKRPRTKTYLAELAQKTISETEKTETKPQLSRCPQCGAIPQIGYACGEYFVFIPSKIAEMCDCSAFCEMHATEEKEIEAWNAYCKEVSNNDINDSILP